MWFKSWIKIIIIKNQLQTQADSPKYWKKHKKCKKSLNINATILKVLSATFLLICFISLNESTFGTR